MKLILLFINLISYFCRIFELNTPITLLNFMKAKHLLLLVSMLVLSMGGGTFLAAQDRIVSGVVADEIGPIYGAAVQVAGTTHGTTTDADGKFSISVSEGSSLLISCLGYESQQIPVDGRDEINVVLKEDSHLLEMATVIGYGSGSKIGTTIGSAATVSEQTIENRPTANVADALQGKVAGLQVYTESGEPSATSSIRLHSAGSIAAETTPLIVLDGVPVSTSVFTALNSNDIESITTLKDASATSIYGSRAANGVIYITTKRGKRNEQVSVVARVQAGISQPASERYEVMTSEELAGYQLGNGLITQQRYDEIMASGVNTNWRKYYYKQAAPVYNVDLSITGGSEKTAYYISGSYLNQEGTAPGSSLERYSFRSNFDVNAKDWLRFGATLALSFDKRSLANTTSNSAYNAAFMSFLSLPYDTPYDENGNEKEEISGFRNPNYMISQHPSGGSNLQINGSAYLQITPVRNLNIKSVFGTNSYAYWGYAYEYPTYSGSLGNGTVSRVHQNGGTFTITNTIDYNVDFVNNEHKLYLLAGQEGIVSDALTFSAQRSGQIRNDIMMLSAASGIPSVADSKSSYAFNSWFARAEYSYMNKYIFDASVRRDASSRFGAANRSGIFYAFGAMWNMKKEKFLADNHVISDLSLKVSYGTQGNAGISNYAHLSHLATTMYGGVLGLYNASEGNEELGWETQSLLTVAASIQFIRRFTLDLEFYNRVSDDLLMDVPVSATTGYTTVGKNVGAMLNRGIDLTLNADLYRDKNWYVGLNATFNYNHNEMLRLFNGLTEYAMTGAGACYAVGHDFCEFYLPIFHGVNPDTGAPQWETVDAETGEIGITEDFNNATYQFTGKKYMAPLTGGFGINVGWRGISLSADFSWNARKYLLNNALIYLENPNYGAVFNRSKRLLNAWKQPGDITDVPKYGYQTYLDSSILEDASFLRLKNLTLSYDFPSELIRKSGFIEGFKVYFISRNLFTVTQFSGYDPEVDSNKSLGEYPNSREFMFGVQFTF